MICSAAFALSIAGAFLLALLLALMMFTLKQGKRRKLIKRLTDFKPLSHDLGRRMGQDLKAIQREVAK